MIEGYVSLWDKVILFSDWEGRITGGESSDEVVFPRLYVAFEGVA